jgi:hypothetical protein
VKWEQEVMEKEVRDDRALRFRVSGKTMADWNLTRRGHDYLVPLSGHIRADEEWVGGEACTSCQAGRGPFKDCCTFEDEDIFDGACTNCVFGGHGALLLLQRS